MAFVTSKNNHEHMQPLEVESERLHLRPAIVVIAGLPAVGKTTLGTALAESSNLVTIDIDKVRQSIFPANLPVSSMEEDRQQMEIAHLATYKMIRQYIQEGKPVVVSATFRSPLSQEAVKKIASEEGVPLHVFHIEAPDEAEIERRLHVRRHQRSNSHIQTIADFARVKTGYRRFPQDISVNTISAHSSIEDRLRHVLEHLRTR